MSGGRRHTSNFTFARGAAAQGHPFEADGGELVVGRGTAEQGRWRGAERAGHAQAERPSAVSEDPSAAWGLAARGAMVEAGSPPIAFGLHRRLEVWADEAATLYAQAAAAQWDPATAIDWDAAFELPTEVEDAVVQVMTYLIENETAALLVPTRFLG